MPRQIVRDVHQAIVVEGVAGRKRRLMMNPRRKDPDRPAEWVVPPTRGFEFSARLRITFVRTGKVVVHAGASGQIFVSVRAGK